MKKKIVIIIPILAVIIIGLIILVINNSENENSNNRSSNKILEEKSEFLEKVKSGTIKGQEIESISDDDLIRVAYNLSKMPDNFVSEKERQYRMGKFAKDSKEAIEEIKNIGISPSGNEKEVDTRIVDETEYYYVVYHEYIVNGERVYKDYYMCLKEEIIDKTIINMNKINSKEKVKNLFDLYILEPSNRSQIILNSEVEENTENYIYTYYYIIKVGGDYGIKDEINLYRNTITINKTTGEYEIANKYNYGELIKTVEGKDN